MCDCRWFSSASGLSGYRTDTDAGPFLGRRRLASVTSAGPLPKPTIEELTPVAENTESTPEETAMNADAVLSLQETQSEEDEVQAHWSSLSIFTGNCGSAQ
jgi:hypothetical protein